MEPTIFHCLFMLSCFGSRLTGGPYELSCPAGCDCFSAAVDGIAGDTSLSFICDGPQPLYSYTSFRNEKNINTLVIRLAEIHSADYPTKPRTHSTLSFILEECRLGQRVEPRNIFNLLEPQILKHLTVLSTRLLDFDWSVLKNFQSLTTIYIEKSPLPEIDESLQSLVFPLLHTFVVKQSDLLYIDRMAFSSVSNTLQRLVITENEIANTLWLTADDRIWPRLRSLDLRDNQLTYLPSGLKRHLPVLEILNVALNNFKYLSTTMLLPWTTSLREFHFADQNTNGKHSKETWYTVYLDADMVALNAKFDPTSSSALSGSYPPFFLDSFGMFRYECLQATRTSARFPFGSLQQCAKRGWIYDYRPDRLYLDYRSQLIHGKTISNQETLPVVKLEGIDLNSVLLSTDKQEFFIDSISNMAEYRAARRLILGQLADQLAGNAIRLHLFGKGTVDFVTTPGQQLSSADQVNLKNSIKWMGEFLEDILSTAGQMERYVMLVIWRYEDFDFSTFDLRDQSRFADYQLRLNSLLLPIMERIHALPGLLGVEIVEGAFRGEFSPNGPQIDEGTCNNIPNGLKGQQSFLHESASELRRQNYAKDLLFGLNIDADCQQCLAVAMLESCRGPTAPVYDFISILSALQSATTEIYSYTNWRTNVPQWFTTKLLLPSNPKDNRPHRPGVFFVLQADLQMVVGLEDAKRELATWASGTFIAPVKSVVQFSELFLNEEGSIVKKV